jgi:hypothetical protein
MGGNVIKSKSGATSSKIPRFDLIPRSALLKMADRFDLGLIKHGKDNWRKGIGNRDYAIERATHVLDHASKLIEKLEGHEPWNGDDDVGAILWGGAFLSEAVPLLCPDLDKIPKKKLTQKKKRSTVVPVVTTKNS